MLLALLPLWSIGDQLRGRPVRAMATAVSKHRKENEAVAMIGILKPSLHYYTGTVIIYEGNNAIGLVNLADRLRKERRQGLSPSSSETQPTSLVVIDSNTARSPFWQGLQLIELEKIGLYRLWRVNRTSLEKRAHDLEIAGVPRTWHLPRPERY